MKVVETICGPPLDALNKMRPKAAGHPAVDSSPRMHGLHEWHSRSLPDPRRNTPESQAPEPATTGESGCWRSPELTLRPAAAAPITARCVKQILKRATSTLDKIPPHSPCPSIGTCPDTNRRVRYLWHVRPEWRSEPAEFAVRTAVPTCFLLITNILREFWIADLEPAMPKSPRKLAMKGRENS